MNLGSGLEDWVRIGSLSRELETYHGFIRKGWGVTIFSYDKSKTVPRLNSKIKVKTKMPKFLPKRLYWLYALLIPFLFYQDGKRISVLKTNQALNCWSALWCGKIWRKRIIARCGRVFGESAETLRLSGLRIFKIKLLEKLTFRYADICFVPTEHLRNWIIEKYKIDPLKIQIIPNHVNVDLFKPIKKSTMSNIKHIIAVGRLSWQKRFDLLIDALEGMNWKLTIIGDGSLKKYLKHRAKRKSVSLNLTGNIPNQELPKYLNKADIFVICSSWEGHPKALIEAMACGCACVGTDSPGINNIIIHKENGLLCVPNSAALENSIKTLLFDEKLRKKVQKNARAYADRHFSSTKVIKREIELAQNLYHTDSR